MMGDRGFKAQRDSAPKLAIPKHSEPLSVPGSEDGPIMFRAGAATPLSPSPIEEPETPVNRPFYDAKSTESLADIIRDAEQRCASCDRRTPLAVTPEGVAFQVGMPSVPSCPRCIERQTSSTISLGSTTSFRKDSPALQEYPGAKHLQTEQLMSKHALKQKLRKYQSYIERAEHLIQSGGSQTAIIEGYTMIAKVMNKSWMIARIGHELAYGLCDFLLESGCLEQCIRSFVSVDSPPDVRFATGLALEECMSAPNRNFIVTRHYLMPIISTARELGGTCDKLRMSISLMESLFKHSAEACLKMIDVGTLEFILRTCKTQNCPTQTLRHAALALANLSMHSDGECAQKIIAKNVPDWLFLLASHRDDVTCYYACLAICMLVSIKEIESQVLRSGTLNLVEPFLLTHKPEEFVVADYKLSQGRPKDWLRKLVWMLGASRKEAKSLAAFHLCMEALVKKSQDRLEVFQEIGAVQALQEVGSSPNEVAAKYSSQALTIIGEEVPYKLSQQVPLWSVEDVQYWVTKIGFEKYAKQFGEQMVDGDLLLMLTDDELRSDLDIQSSLLRKRFMRELQSLKISADYSCVDETNLDSFLMAVAPELSVYTYRMLEMGFDRSLVRTLTDDTLSSVCGMHNPIHRLKLIQALQDCKGTDDIEMAILSRQIDIFISYRRSGGNQLASLIKVLLQLKGYKVFIDVDRLFAGKFDASLLKNIQAARHFVLVLTENCLDRVIGDEECDDWVHKELRCAMEHSKNIIPIFDSGFVFPEESQLPEDIRSVTRFNGIRWVHEYQEACVDKLDKFIKAELNRTNHNSNESPRRSMSVVNIPNAARSAAWNSYTRLPQFAINNSKLTPSVELSDLGAY